VAAVNVNGELNMTPEARVKNEIKKMLEAHEVYYFMPAAN
jgi:hypothetical protein